MINEEQEKKEREVEGETKPEADPISEECGACGGCGGHSE